jgi:hypothetical protein
MNEPLHPPASEALLLGHADCRCRDPSASITHSALEFPGVIGLLHEHDAGFPHEIDHIISR